MAVQIALPMSCYPPMPLWPPTLALGSPWSRPRWSLYLGLSLNYSQRWPQVIMASPLVINISINKVFLKWPCPQLQNSILQIWYYPRLLKVSTCWCAAKVKNFTTARELRGGHLPQLLTVFSECQGTPQGRKNPKCLTLNYQINVHTRQFCGHGGQIRLESLWY